MLVMPAMTWRAPSSRSTRMPLRRAARWMAFESPRVQDDLADVVVEHHQLVDADSTAVALVAARSQPVSDG
jgi:hypothetical protein